MRQIEAATRRYLGRRIKIIYKQRVSFHTATPVTTCRAPPAKPFWEFAQSVMRLASVVHKEFVKYRYVKSPHAHRSTHMYWDTFTVTGLVIGAVLMVAILWAASVDTCHSKPSKR